MPPPTTPCRACLQPTVALTGGLCGDCQDAAAENATDLLLALCRVREIHDTGDWPEAQQDGSIVTAAMMREAAAGAIRRAVK